jgi:hypothetical protein
MHLVTKVRGAAGTFDQAVSAQQLVAPTSEEPTISPGKIMQAMDRMHAQLS